MTSNRHRVASGLFIAKAKQTVRHITGAWVKEQSVAVEDGEIVGYRVDLKVTFLLD